MIRNALELGTIWAQTWLLLDDLIRPQQQGLRDGQAEGLGGLHVDHQLEFRRLLHRKVSGLLTLEYPIDIICRLPKKIGDKDSIGH